MKKILTATVLSIVCFACAQKHALEKNSDGVIVRPDDGPARAIRIQVVSENIMRVTASPADTFSRVKSLMIVPPTPEEGSWSVQESGDEIVVTTPVLKAVVSQKTGEVRFADKDGNVLLQEQEGGGKTFIASNAAPENGFRLRQVFESPADEAFYGLGAHQNGQMNYKGEDVHLIQHNIVDVVPFVYSSKNYGVLWDNYSIGKFGDPREYQSLNTLQLFDRDGNAGGLTADYYVNGKLLKSNVENKIDYEYLETPQVDSFPADVSSAGKIVWEGSFTSAKNGEHKFLVYAAGYFKVWVDGKLIMDKWRQNWNPWTNKFRVNIANGEKHSVRIEWTPDGGRYMAFKHLDPITPEEQNRHSIAFEAGDELDYYFIKGSNADEVISGYRALTGKPPIVPKWALGFWQSRERYRSQDELLKVVSEYRKRKIPLDNIVLDWQYWEDPKWGSHEFDARRFPDPAGMVAQLHERLHANIMISVWPKFNKGTKHYEEMRKNGFLFVRNIEKKRKDWVGPGYESTFYDPFNERAGNLFWKQIDERLNSIGIDAWWLDATEPDIHSNLSVEERKVNMTPTALGPGEKYFNAYSLMNSKSVYEGQRKSSPDKRVFILTRSAYAGQQRYGATTWSGDIVSRWSDLQDQISAGVNFSLSGIPYWTMDIGGFAVENRYINAFGETLDEWRELNTRWFQFGAFVPVFRSHGQYPVREIFNISPEGHPAYKSMVYYDQLRYKLLPYIYSLAGWTYFKDYTIMRGLVMDFNDDTRVREIADQYMFGPSLLINPVCEFKARSRQVYLPQGAGWYDLYTGKYSEGAQLIQAEAPYERMPLFVKEGAIIPTGPDLQYTTEKPADPLTIYVYAGQNGRFDLYEDEGTNYAYEQGSYATISFAYDDSTRTLSIGARKGAFKNMLEERNFHIIWVNRDRPVGLGATTQPAQVVKYQGDPVSIQLK